MACVVPGCKTRYWDRNNKRSMFRAPSAKQVGDWQRILSSKGVVDFGKNDLICILHFEEKYVERERTIYQPGGIVSKQRRKVLLLSYDAVPSIFPSDCELPKTVKKEKKKKIESYFVYTPVVDIGILAERRKVFEEKLSSDTAVSSNDIIDAKQIKINDLFQSILNRIRNRQKVLPHLNNFWIANIVDEKSVRWSLWNADRSVENVGVILHEDLRFEVFANEKKIHLTERSSVIDMCELENLFKKVCNILPCKKAKYASQESENNCLGFVIKNVGRPRVWCAPCNKYRRNMNRRVTQDVKIHKLEDMKHNLHVRCNKLRRKNELLKIEAKELKRNVLSLRKQCSEADKLG